MSFALFLLYTVFTYLRPFEYAGEGLEQYRPMLLLWILAFFPALFNSLATRSVAARSLHFKLLAAFAGSIVVSCALRAGPGYALAAVMHFSTSAMLMVLALLNLTTLRRLRITCGVIAACVVVLAIVGIVSYHTGYDVERYVLRQTIDRGNYDAAASHGDQALPEVPAKDDSGRYMWRVRSIGFLNDPNDFAQAMVVALPFLWLRALRGGLLRKAVTLGAPMAVLLYAIFLTHSRGAIVGLAVMALLGLRRIIGTMRAGVLTAAVMGVVVFTAFSGGRSFSTQEQSAGNRIDAWWSGIEMLKAYPVFGVGYYRFEDHYPLTAHNSFVLCFAELGLVGLLIWVGLLVITYLGLTAAINDQRASRDWPVEARTASLLRASLIGSLTCSWFLSRTYSPNLYMLLALCIAGWYCADKAARAQGAELPRRGIVWPSIGASMASIAAVYGTIMLQGGPS